MENRRVAAGAVLILAMTATPLAAQEPATPFVVPQHDVDIVYAVPLPVQAGAPAPDGSMPAVIQRVRYSVTGSRQRVDPPGPGTYMLTDYTTGLLTMVQPDQHLATTIPAPGGPVAAHGERAHGTYARLDDSRIAGFSCTDWRTQDDAGQESVVCLTEDGVLLRAMQGTRILVQAQTVSYGPQDPSLFTVPAGYRLQQPPTPPVRR